jgi:tRNA threonylcarbamoyladenosine biosynthesis protein TsaB
VKLLAIETATEACSAALLVDGEVAARHEEMSRGHAERILPMVDELLGAAGLALGRLDAIAFGRGPGGFTGLRLAASVVQGLAYGAGLPVLPVSTLRAVAQSALELDPAAEAVLVCNDARMNEVYWAGYLRDASGLAAEASPERVGAAATVERPPALQGLAACGAGRGFIVYPGLGERLGLPPGPCATLLPAATSILRLAVPDWLAGRGVPAGSALPIYVRDDVARPANAR